MTTNSRYEIIHPQFLEDSFKLNNEEQYNNFTVNQTKFPRSSHFVKSYVDSINNSKSLTEARQRIEQLSLALKATGAIAAINYEFIPDSTSKSCGINIVVTEKYDRLSPFRIQQGLPNHFKLEHNLYNITNNFQTITFGKKYKWDSRSDSLYFRTSIPYTIDTFTRFSAQSLVKDIIRDQSKEYSTKTTFQLMKVSQNIKQCYGVTVKDRNNKYSDRSKASFTDLLQSQLYTLFYKRSFFIGDSKNTLKFKLGVDPTRIEYFSSISHSFNAIFQLKSHVYLDLNMRSGVISGQNLAENDLFSCPRYSERAQSFLNPKFSVFVTDHPVLAGLNIIPFSFVNAWVSSRDYRLRNVKKSGTLGLGFQLSAGAQMKLEVGLLDFDQNKLVSNTSFKFVIET